MFGLGSELGFVGFYGGDIAPDQRGTHVDMNRAALYFASTENAMVEVHAGSDQVQQWN